MGHPICRRVHTCFLVILLVPLAVSTAKADINNTVFSQPDSGMYGFTSLNQKCRPFNVNSEAAEFDVRGQVERIVVDGRILGQITQYKHVTVKFLAVFRPSTGTRTGRTAMTRFIPPFRSVYPTTYPRWVISMATADRTCPSFARRTAHATG